VRKFIEDLTISAGKKLLEYFGKDSASIKKRSLAKQAASKYDKLIDNLIIKKIREFYPTHSILTEESGFLKGNSEFLWVVDSLDGTGNFSNFNPFFCVCIALMKGNELILGTIYAPAIDEFYLACKTKGAYFNHKKITVSNISSLSKSYILYCEGAEINKLRVRKILNRVYPKVVDLRKLGSAGLEIAWVASGRYEAYFTTKIDPWDVAPGVLLVEEAGGKVTDFKGNFWELKRKDVLFSNKKIHSQILNLIGS